MGVANTLTVQAAALYGYDSSRQQVESTFQMIYMAGWSPDPTQPRAAKRGSATASMKDIQSSVEQSRKR
jgi:hypothetical protein